MKISFPRDIAGPNIVMIWIENMHKKLQLIPTAPVILIP